MLGTFTGTEPGSTSRWPRLSRRSALASPPGATLACTKLMKQKDRHERDPVRACFNSQQSKDLSLSTLRQIGLDRTLHSLRSLLVFCSSLSISKCRRPAQGPLVACLRSFRGGIPRCTSNQLTILSRQMNLLTKAVSSPGLLSSVGRRTCGGRGQSR